MNRVFEDAGEAGYHEARAKLGRADLFYLLVYLLHRKDMLNQWVFERVNEVQAAPDGYIDLWAREHYKSTIGTFGLNIQEILKNQEVTIGIFSHTRTIATDFLKQIKNELQTNEELKFLYPDILWGNPEKQAAQWSEEGITVKRKGNQKEATVEAWGVVDSQPTSKHFEILDYDDLVTDKTVNTPAQIKKTIDAWSNSLNLGRRDGRVRYFGTKWHFGDPYAEIIKRKAAIPRVKPATKNGKPDGEPVLMTTEQLRAKRTTMGAYTFGCQMLLDPKADETLGFKIEWLRHWTGANTNGLTKILLVDPASKKNATSDNTAMWVLGYGADDRWYQLDTVYDKLNLKQRVLTTIKLHRTWRPIFTGYEEYGLQADIEAIEWEQERTNYRFDITKLGGQLKKEDRILRLQPIFENGRFYLLNQLLKQNWEGSMQDLVQVFTNDEYNAFPVGDHDDMMDALSRIEDAEVKAAISVAGTPGEPAPSQTEDPETLEERMLRLQMGGRTGAASRGWMGA